MCLELLTQKKRKLFQMLAVVLAFAVIISMFSIFSAVTGAMNKKYTKQGELTGFKAYKLSELDATNPAKFSTFDIKIPGYEKVAENESLCLFSDENQKGIKVYDKRSKHLWSSIVDDPAVLNSNITDGIKVKMQSMLIFSYVDLTGASAIERETNSINEACNITKEKIKNGIRYNYDFYKLNIKLSLDMIINGSDFQVTVPSDLIVENENGSDKMVNVKKDIEEKINRLKDYCTDIDKTSKKNKAFSDSLKQLISVSTVNIIGAFMIVSDQIGSGEISTDKLDAASESIDVLASVIVDNQDILKKLEQIKQLVEEGIKQSKYLANNRTTGITKLQIAPYFGYQTSKTNGYAFYPDQNGAISYFNRLHSASSGAYYQDVYDIFLQLVPLSASLEKYKTGYISPATMPVFGVKADESGFLAILSSGDSDSAIGYNPILPDLDCANIYSSFYLRKKTTIVTSNGSQSELYDNLRTKINWQITYRMLANGDADYSGMARTYRSYLLETGRLKKSDIMNGKMPLCLNFFMGAKSQQKGLTSKYITMTNYGFIQDYIKSLESKGIPNFMLSISGWMQNFGVKDPDLLVPAKQTGSKGGLKSLSDYFKSKNYSISLSLNSVMANRKDLSSSLIELATVKNKNQLTIENYGRHVLNPGYIYNKTTSDYLKKLEKLGVNGVYYEDLAYNLYFDYNKIAKADRNDTSNIFKNLAVNSHKTLNTVVTENANAYMLSGTDWNKYLPSEDSKYLFTDENIPFYQMVVHGYMIYTGNGENYQYDHKVQTLKNIEYGYLPFYFLTENEPFEIRNEGYSGFFSTVAKNWFASILETYKKYEKDFNGTWNIEMTEHKRLNKYVSRTIYANGIRIYVNYSETEQKVDNLTIKPFDYVIVK